MIGSGKTTTAGHLADWLARRGEDVRAFDEGAADRPIRTRRVDELLAAPAPGDPDAYSAGRVGRTAGRTLPARRADRSSWRASSCRTPSCRPSSTAPATAATVTRSAPRSRAGGARRAVPGLPAAGRHRGRDRARPPGPRGAVVLAGTSPSCRTARGPAAAACAAAMPSSGCTRPGSLRRPGSTTGTRSASSWCPTRSTTGPPPCAPSAPPSAPDHPGARRPCCRPHRRPCPPADPVGTAMPARRPPPASAPRSGRPKRLTSIPSASISSPVRLLLSFHGGFGRGGLGAA